MGSGIIEQFAERYECIPISRYYLKPDKFPEFKILVSKHRPEVIINAAAVVGLLNVESNYNLALHVNSELPGVLGKLSRIMDFKLIQISTNSVFEQTSGYAYYEDSHPAPISKYAQTKFAGEQKANEHGGNVVILRVPNLYSKNLYFETNLLKKLVQNIKTNNVVISKNEIISI